MLMNVYSVYDKTAEEFGPPYTAVNDGVAKRSYRDLRIPDAIKDEYELHLIGVYDTKTGDIVPEVKYIVPTEVSNG